MTTLTVQGHSLLDECLKAVNEARTPEELQPIVSHLQAAFMHAQTRLGDMAIGSAWRGGDTEWANNLSSLSAWINKK